ncbi:alpha/beta hydrolase [Kribbella catacumbae]|uniref:alpha/beta hydrolase n=1 Tax=Kribbella catacumbae TaxID=460086 RepID=UPI0003669CC6|nr:alpha/beta hydrolase [Kribbella catacumbae]
MTTTTSTDGTKLEYDRTGSGPAVVLIGAGPTGRTANAELAALLSASCTVLNYDRRGRGGSGDTAPYSVDRELEDLAAVVAAAGEDVSLFGTSGGAMLAFKAVANGLSVRRIAVWEPPYILPGSRPPVPADYADQQAALAAAGDRSGMAELFLSQAAGLPPEFVKPLMDGPYWGFLEAASSPALMYDAQLAGDFSLDPAQQAKITCPLLILDGNTTDWLTQAANAVADASPVPIRQTLPGQQHNVESSALAEPLIKFLHED